jgi:hypothetical protein
VCAITPGPKVIVLPVLTIVALTLDHMTLLGALHIVLNCANFYPFLKEEVCEVKQSTQLVQVQIDAEEWGWDSLNSRFFCLQSQSSFDFATSQPPGFR